LLVVLVLGSALVPGFTIRSKIKLFCFAVMVHELLLAECSDAILKSTLQQLVLQII
jgi:hypothetical protein